MKNGLFHLASYFAADENNNSSIKNDFIMTLSFKTDRVAWLQ